MTRPDILVVEDQPSMRRLITYGLQKHFDVRAACNGREALEQIEAQVPNLIVSDLMMPIMDGLQLLRAIRAHPRYTEIPFIVLTAKANEADRRECREAGADDYLVKPVALPILVNSVKHLLTAWPASPGE